jgi:hypothetical protein
MPMQKIPDIEFNEWVIGTIPTMLSKNEIYINKNYQRGDIWKLKQKIELIKSINNSRSIGVIVQYENDNKQHEILDGQQRLITIQQYIEGNLDIKSTDDIVPYNELSEQEKILFNAYCVYYIRLKSQNPETREEDVILTFLRLQEGTPLNKAEKLNAYPGKFKDTFRELRNTHPIFAYLGEEKRFRWRQLAAELLTLELETNYDTQYFPNLDLPSMIDITKKYEKRISDNKIKSIRSNLDFLNTSLNLVLTAFQPREYIAFYMLISYLRKYTRKENIMNEFYEFTTEFLKNLNSFAIYDEKPPLGMTKALFNKYKSFKHQSKVMTTPESLKTRFQIMIDEYNRLNSLIITDKNRLFDSEQKRILYFRQKGLCGFCGNKMIFDVTTGHHIIKHSQGGSTDDLDKAVLLEEKCHRKIEKQIAKGQVPIFPFQRG